MNILIVTYLPVRLHNQSETRIETVYHTIVVAVLVITIMHLPFSNATLRYIGNETMKPPICISNIAQCTIKPT